MISESLRRLSDLMAGHILNGPPLTISQLSAISLELMDHARVVAVMETLPFDVTLALLNATPETPFVRTSLRERQP